ncbi:hypothetical protein B0H14DRAFT_2557397 [Mycena olivaceomarginata]|nr:hypothetical protein B0H14DRAFT_2557397 [Mycena olivaceomarginata]
MTTNSVGLSAAAQNLLSETVPLATEEDDIPHRIFELEGEHLLMLLICKRGLVPDLLNSDDWKAIVRHVNPNLKPTPSSEFTTQIIPTEAAKVKLLTESALQKAGPICVWCLSLSHR